MRSAIRELARRRDVPFSFVECHAPREVLLQRLAKRAERGAQESDARADLLDDFERKYEPSDELLESEHLRIDTSAPHELNRKRLASMFGV